MRRPTLLYVTIAEPRHEGPSAASLGAGQARVGYPAAWWQRLGTTPHLVAVAVGAVILRLPYVGTPLTPDEAGFSLVARQWSPGPSLYGRFWVDRPPLLIELFRLASHAGTPGGLRLLGCLAAFSATLLVGLCAKGLAGQRAGFWAACVAAVGFSSPALGALPVNGELLAAPFIAASIWAWVESARHPTPRWGLLAVSGATASAAVLVKQNMVDGLLFFGVVTALQVTLHRPDRLSLARTVGTWLAGAVGAAVAVLGLASVRGSSIGGIWFAMYPFRLAAADTIQGASRHAHLVALGQLTALEMLSLGPIVLAVLGLIVVRHRRVRAFDVRVVAPAVLVVAVYDLFSIVAGASYWPHYLVQLVVPTALAAGILTGRTPRLAQPLAAVVVSLSLALGATAHGQLPTDHGPLVGEAIADVAEPGDTIVSTFGDAEIVAASGLRSNYEYLWSLPARTLDPNLTTLATLLEGPDAPTWMVVRGPRTAAALLRKATGAPLRQQYHAVAHLCGRIVYLRDNLDRHVPVSPAQC